MSQFVNYAPLLDDVKRAIDGGEDNWPEIEKAIDAIFIAGEASGLARLRDLDVHVERWRSQNDTLPKSGEFEHNCLDALDYIHERLDR